MKENLKTKKITYIIPHTHWDREWYIPFQNFRFRLVTVTDDLLKILEQNPEYHYFNLDCQTIVLEDYLEIRPENRKRLEKLIQAGRIGVGPWYCQSCPILQTGEGLIRNLLRGVKICREFGVKSVNLAYVPDQFIHTTQLPQIYRGFGLDFAAFSRGMANQYDEIAGLKAEFNWKGLDGSKVVCFHLRTGYGSNAHLGKDITQAINQIALGIAKLNEISWSTSLQLTFAGSDHCGAEEILLKAIKSWNEDEELTSEMGNIKLASWEEYQRDFMALRPNLKEVSGEFFGRRYQITLHGVYSSYIPLKQRSFALHDLLERWAEPFEAWMTSQGMPSLQDFNDEAWKWVLQNQPHDSAWTSSCDQVMKEMETRYDWAEQIAEEVFRRSAQWIIQHQLQSTSPNDIRIIIFNPLPWPRSGIIHARISDKTNTIGYYLADEEGHELTHQIMNIDPTGNNADRYRRRVYVPSHGSLGQNFREIVFTAENVPPIGYQTYFFRKRDLKLDTFQPPTPGLIDGNDSYLENDIIRVTVEADGSISLMEKADEKPLPPSLTKAEGLIDLSNLDGSQESKYTYNRLHLLEDISDSGDGWEFRPITGDVEQEIPMKNVRTQLIMANDSVGTLKVDYILKIPEGLSEDHSQRSDQLVEIPVQLFITLHKGTNPMIEFHTTIKNTAKNHRLRVRFPTPFKSDVIHVNDHFGIHARKIALPDGGKWNWPPEAILPHQKFLSLWDTNQNRGFALVTKGIPIYETIQNPNGAIDLALTLYRSVSDWGNHIGIRPPMQTPDGLLLNKTLTFDYALILQDAPWDNDSITGYRLAEEFYTPLRWEEDYDAFRYQVEPSKKNLPWHGSLLRIDSPGIMLSTIKAATDKSGDMIVRVYNIKHIDVDAELKFTEPITSAQFCDLKEDPIPSNELHITEKKNLSWRIGPAKIATLRIKKV